MIINFDIEDVEIKATLVQYRPQVEDFVKRQVDLRAFLTISFLSL